MCGSTISGNAAHIHTQCWMHTRENYGGNKNRAVCEQRKKSLTTIDRTISLWNEMCTKMQIENKTTSNAMKCHLRRPTVWNLFHDENIFDMRFPLSLLSRTYSLHTNVYIRFMSNWRINRTKKDLQQIFSLSLVSSQSHRSCSSFQFPGNLSWITFSILFARFGMTRKWYYCWLGLA